jgi:hypothetical protein
MNPERRGEVALQTTETGALAASCFVGALTGMWQVVDVWTDCEAWVRPDAKLSNDRLRAMTAEEVWDYFTPYMRPMRNPIQFLTFSDILNGALELSRNWGGQAYSADSSTRNERVTAVLPHPTTEAAANG